MCLGLTGRPEAILILPEYQFSLLCRCGADAKLMAVMRTCKSHFVMLWATVWRAVYEAQLSS